ncbi:MAG: phosphoadenylyl-sulfate reductase [bacterium]
MTELKKKITELNDRFGKADSKEILAYLASYSPGKVVFSTSFGVEDQVITEMLHAIIPPVSVFTLDTGRLFPETYDLLSATRSKYGMDIRVIFPDFNQVEEMVNKKGINLFYDSFENRKLCCRVRKVIPLTRALRGVEFWISGLRKDQSSGRSEISLFEWDEDHRLIRVHPLADWSTEKIWEYAMENKVPYNPLHDKGFSSIGCQPCTRAVLPGEDFRAGRWWWEPSGKKECGIHQHNK